MAIFHVYFDLTLLENPEIPVWDVLSRVWRGVHGASVKAQVPFAVAFPRYMNRGFQLGNVFRVFVSSTEEAERLYDMIDSRDDLKEWVSGSRIRAASKTDRYEAYVMHRLSSSTVGLQYRQNEEMLNQQHLRRTRQLAQQQSLPFVRMRSSTGNAFRLVFERVAVAADASGMPNGYGLSRRNSLVAIPVVD